MNINKYISSLYPIVQAFEGINTIEEMLLNENYIVVLDSNEFIGILTPNDLIKRPHKLVIDCLTPKDKLSSNDTIASVLNKFNTNKSLALPVFEKDKFIGIVKRENLIESLKIKIQDLYEQSIISHNLKDSFLKYLSHEVRSPLNSILGFMEIISNLDMKELHDKTYFNIVKDNADRFLLKMNDIVDLARINSGENLEIQINDIAIEKILIRLKDDIKTALLTSQNKKISIDYEITPNCQTIQSDERKINHILYHLIQTLIHHFNCYKIHIKYKTYKNNILFSVTGIETQIRENKKEKIIAIFNENNDTNKSNEINIGIELSLIKKMSNLLGGKIDLIIDQKKTIFLCTIPLKKEEKICI